MKVKQAAILASIVGLFLSLSGHYYVSAQSTSGSSTQVAPTSNSMRISPVRTDVTVDPGTTKTITVYAQNMTTQTVQVRAIVSDFQASTDESGRPNVILEEDRYAPSHSLKRLASIEPKLIDLAPNTRTPVKLTLTVPKNAMAGGYYGAVRFLPANITDTGDTSGVSISANLGSLVLLKVNGDLKEKLELLTLETRQKDKPGTFFKSSDDIVARVRFKNTGNVQVQPFGKIRLLDRSGKVLEEHEINNTDPRGNVLPTTVRRFETKLENVGSFGKYTLEGNFGYGSNGELITSKMSFWVVPTTYMIGAAGGLIIIGLIIFLIVKVTRLSGGRRRTYGRRY